MDQASVVMAINIEKNIRDFYYIRILFPLRNFNVVRDTKFSKKQKTTKRKKKTAVHLFLHKIHLKKKSLEKTDGNRIKIRPLGKKIKSFLCHTTYTYDSLPFFRDLHAHILNIFFKMYHI